MSTTSTDLVQDTLRHLHSSHRDPQNKLNGSLNTSVTTVVLTYDLGAVAVGAVLSVDLELMYVWAVDNATTKTITVQREYLGSTAATHADAAVVTVNPKFPPFDVLNEINNELDDLSGNGLFKVATVSVTYSPSVQGYNLTSVSNLIEILEVKYDEPGPGKEWPLITNWKLKRDSSTTDFASGLALVLRDAGHPGNAVRVTYATTFTRFTALGETILTQTGLPATANDIPPLGAALRLQTFREPQRNFNESQGQPRRAGEVQTGAQLVGARAIEELRRRRIRIEARRLQKDWPAKKKLPS